MLKVELLRARGSAGAVALVIDDDPAVIAAMTAAGYRTMRASWEARAPARHLALVEAQETEGRT